MPNSIKNGDNKMSDMEYINVISLFLMGLTATIRGFFWIISSEEQSQDSPLYKSMHEMVNLTFWGVPFFIGGLCLIIAAIALPYRKVNNIFSVAIIIGGIICAIFFFIITLAGMNNALNWLSPATFFVMSMGYGGYAYFGVLFYRKR